MTFVRDVMAASMRCGSILNVRGSGSTGTGVAPALLTASQVAIYVLEGTTTSSPGPTSHARRIKCKASNPLLTPTQCCAPTYAANSCSNARTSLPRMYRPLASTRATAASSSCFSSAYGAVRSRNGIAASVIDVLVMVADVVAFLIVIGGEHEADRTGRKPGQLAPDAWRHIEPVISAVERLRPAVHAVVDCDLESA